VDFAEKYKTKPIFLDEEARGLLTTYSWPGNVRELKNIAEQISVLSTNPQISASVLKNFLPEKNRNSLPVLANYPNGSNDFSNEREILYKLFFDMKKDVTELKKMFLEILQNPSLAGSAANFTRDSILNDFHSNGELSNSLSTNNGNANSAIQPSFINQSSSPNSQPMIITDESIHHHEEIEESLNIMDKEKELIVKALKKHKGKRRDASLDLGISERTLYRKLKEYDIDE